MHRRQALLTLLRALAPAAGFSGESALRYTAKAVSFGPRPPGSDASRRLQAYIVSQLKTTGCEVIEDPFTARTPLGPVAMNNITARFRGTSGRALAITGHYDTKRMPDVSFVGANDGGSSTGFLLEMVRVLAGRSNEDDVYLVWFDGEEALVEWSDTDGLYGSRHFARRWSSGGVSARLKALINVDMIGDRDLGILQEMGSSPGLRKLVWQVAAEIGYGRYFLDVSGYIGDDHAPFAAAGVNALDLIDFDYGPGNSYWHTAQDTMDKLSAHSLQVVGDVLVEVIRRLER
jgi:Zn-dependent M28 family amino/carboxypeptidase